MAAVMTLVEALTEVDEFCSNHQPNIEVGLYVNDVTPTRDTVIGDLTEASFTGYARIPIGPFAGATDQTTFVQALAANLQWTAGVDAPIVLYGFFIWDFNTNQLVCVQRATGAPVTLPTSVDTYTVTPTVVINA